MLRQDFPPDSISRLLALQAFQELMDRAREAVGQGPNSAAALCQQAVARLEAVMTGARKAMEGLARIELATAGCLESSFEQVHDPDSS